MSHINNNNHPPTLSQPTTSDHAIPLRRKRSQANAALTSRPSYRSLKPPVASPTFPPPPPAPCSSPSSSTSPSASSSSCYGCCCTSSSSASGPAEGSAGLGVAVLPEIQGPPAPATKVGDHHHRHPHPVEGSESSIDKALAGLSLDPLSSPSWKKDQHQHQHQHLGSTSPSYLAISSPIRRIQEEDLSIIFSLQTLLFVHLSSNQEPTTTSTTSTSSTLQEHHDKKRKFNVHIHWALFEPNLFLHSSGQVYALSRADWEVTRGKVEEMRGLSGSSSSTTGSTTTTTSRKKKKMMMLEELHSSSAMYRSQIVPPTSTSTDTSTDTDTPSPSSNLTSHLILPTSPSSSQPQPQSQSQSQASTSHWEPHVRTLDDLLFFSIEYTQGEVQGEVEVGTSKKEGHQPQQEAQQERERDREDKILPRRAPRQIEDVLLLDPYLLTARYASREETRVGLGREEEILRHVQDIFLLRD